MLTKIFAATITTLALFAGTAAATPGPADDRLIDSKTSWMTRASIGVDELTTIVNTGDWRPTDLRVENTSPLTFSAMFVRNTGAYAVASPFFFHGATFSDQIAALRANNRRPIIMQAFVADDGTTRVAGISVPNTGANARAWSAEVGGLDFVVQNLPSGHRPMTIATFLNDDDDRRYLILSVANTENYGWWWWFNIKAAQLGTQTGTNHSLIDGSANDDDNMNLNVIYYNVPNNSDLGLKWFEGTRSELVQEASDSKSRPLFITHFTLHGSGSADGETEWFSSFNDNLL